MNNGDKAYCFANGKFFSGNSSDTFYIRGPEFGCEYRGVSDAQLSCVAEILEMEKSCVANLKGAERTKILLSAVSNLEGKVEEIAGAVNREQGKSLKEAEAEVRGALEYARWHAKQSLNGMCRKRASNGTRGTVNWEALGTALLLTPWNMPFSIPIRKIFNAVVAGCRVVVKPSDLVPSAAKYIVDALVSAGFPPLGVSLLTGNPDKIFKMLTDKNIVDVVSFTGSLMVGKLIREKCEMKGLKSILELGGNSPAILDRLYPVNEFASALLSRSIKNAGQICIGVRRVYVPDTAVDELRLLLIDKITKYNTCSTGCADRTSDIINGHVYNKIDEALSSLLDGKIRIVFQEQKMSSLHYPITILEACLDNYDMNNIEILGPVFCLIPYSNLNEAVAHSNATNYGLSAYVFSNKERSIREIVDKLDYGIVGVNTFESTKEWSPMAGRKDSGRGVEGGEFGILEYCKCKYVNYNCV